MNLRTLDWLKCRLAGWVATRAAWAGDPLPDRVAPHTGQCLTCQVRLAQVRLLTRTLQSIKDEVYPAPSGLVGDVIARLEEPVPAPVPVGRLGTLSRRNLAPALMAATAAAAVVLIARRRAAA